MNPTSWYEFRNSADSESTDLFIYDSIGGFGVSANRFLADLQNIPSNRPITLRIHSPGGDVFDGQAIFTALQRHAGGVTTHIDGLAASMAAVISMAGSPVQMAGNGMFMIHNVAGGAMGESDDLRKAADMMDKVQETITRIFVGKTGLTRKQVTDMMDAETWLTAREAKELGFVDKITGDLKMAACFDLSQFKNAAQLTEKLAAMKTTAAEPTVITGTEDTVVTTVSDETTLIAELEESNLLLTSTIADLEKENEELTAKVDGFVQVTDTLEAEKVELTNSVTQLTAKVAELEASAKTAEERAREIAARAGADLPSRTPTDGVDQTKTTFTHLKGRARATAYLASRMPKPL